MGGKSYTLVARRPFGDTVNVSVGQKLCQWQGLLRLRRHGQRKGCNGKYADNIGFPLCDIGLAGTPALFDLRPRPQIRSSCRSTNAACGDNAASSSRSEEHTSELQSQSNLVCRLLL